MDENSTQEQAQRLLGARDYARSAARVICPAFHAGRHFVLARMIAAFICTDVERRTAVYRWSRARWRNNADPDVIDAAIAQTKYFGAVEAFLCDVLADMRDAGATSLGMISPRDESRGRVLVTC